MSDIKLWQGDCLKLMKDIPDHSVDLVLCDPPYGTTSCAWDSVIPLDSLWLEYERITKANSAIVIFGSEPFSSQVRLSNLSNYHYDLYWVKEKPTNFFQLKRRAGKCTENIMVFYKEQCTYNPQMTPYYGKPVKNQPKASHNSIVSGINNHVITPYEDNGLRYPTDVLEFRREPLGTTIHPTQKPLDLIEYLIKTYTNGGDLVLDNCMGSGTTGVACKHLDRNFIGIELDPDYFELAKSRIENATFPIKLF